MLIEDGRHPKDSERNSISLELAFPSTAGAATLTLYSVSLIFSILSFFEFGLR